MDVFDPSLQVSTYVVLLASSGLVALYLLVVSLRHRHERIALPLALLFLSAGVWALADAARLLVLDQGAMDFWYALRITGASAIGLFWFWVVVEYVERQEYLTRELLLVLGTVPALTVLILWSGVYRELVVTTTETIQYTDPVLGGTFETIDPSFGPWFYFNALYNYVLILLALGMLARRFRRSSGLDAYRGQTATMILGLLLPMVVNWAFHVRLIPVDLTATSFSVGLALLAIAIFRYELFTLIPIARNSAVESMDEGFVVLDRNDRVVDVNAAVARMVGRPVEALVDRDAAEVLPAFHDRFDDEDRTEELHAELAIDVDGTSRHFDVRVSPILDARTQYVGRVVLAKDVTERIRRTERLRSQKTELQAQKTELERQNERLEEFASVVSHDLRNPINVIQAYVQMAIETGDDECLQEIGESVDRMEGIVEDVLEMARQGKTVLEAEPIQLDDVARDAWAHVETGNASLDVRTERRITGDRSRLLQVFENVFRNAVEHGIDPEQMEPSDGSSDLESDDDPNETRSEQPRDEVNASVTVTVGDLPDGFYVEDDGQGIPPDRRESIFEHGVTSNPGGTGYGLAIVRMAIEAHGWTIDVAEGADGGARFEVSGISIADEIANTSTPPGSNV